MKEPGLRKAWSPKPPLMKRREEDEASTTKTPRRHRSDEEEQEIERRALTTPPPDGQEEQEIERRALTTPHRTDKRSRRLSNELSPHPHRTDKRKRQRRKSRDATAPMKRSRRSSDKLSPHPHRTDPLQSEDSHAKTPSPREDAKNVVYPTEELKDAADTPLMSQWREREKLLELMEGRIPHPESSSPLLQSSSRATKNQKIYRTPKGPVLPSRLLPRRHRKCKSRRALTPLQMKGLQKDPPNLKSTIQEKPPPPRRRARSSSYPEKDPKKKEEKFQLPREGPGPKAPSQVANRSGETKSKPASPPRTLKLKTPQRPRTRSGTPHLTPPGLPDRRRQRSADGFS